MNPSLNDESAALRARLSALTIAAIDYREGIRQREEDEAEWCAAGQTVSREELARLAAALDAALAEPLPATLALHLPAEDLFG